MKHPDQRDLGINVEKVFIFEIVDLDRFLTVLIF